MIMVNGRVVNLVAFGEVVKGAIEELCTDCMVSVNEITKNNVDSILNVGALSSKFTQDIEDMDIIQDAGKDAGELKPKSKTERPATKKQLDYLLKLMQQHGNTEESMNRYVKQAYGVDDYKKITGVQCSELIEKYKALDENK